MTAAVRSWSRGWQRLVRRARRVAPALACGLALADPTPFKEDDLLNERVVDEARCAARPGFVWGTYAGQGACLSYWAAGLQGGAATHVMVYLTGDVISGDRAHPAYLTRSPAGMQQFVDDTARELGVPVLLLARPGTYGSTGNHKQRRRAPEARLVSAALDRLRATLGVERLSVVGFSGGGHVAASLIAWRSDLACVVLASSVSSPRLRWQALGLSRDVTGYDDSVEPAKLYTAPLPSRGLRVWIVGDAGDSNTPWPTQTPIGGRLRELGVPVEEVLTPGEGPERHDVTRHARRIGGDCMRS